jgi:tetratricopeptide (TPR) repeat protein
LPNSWPEWQTLSLAAYRRNAVTASFAQTRAVLAVGWLWFVGVLVPTIGIIQASTQAMADRFVYLPSIGFFIAFVWGIDAWLRRLEHGRSLATAAAFMALVAAGAVTWRQLGYWQNSTTLFSHALAVTKDNPVAHINLGSVLEESGRRDEAVKHYREAIRISRR